MALIVILTRDILKFFDVFLFPTIKAQTDSKVLLKFECGEIWATAPYLYEGDFLSKGYRDAEIGKAGKPS